MFKKNKDVNRLAAFFRESKLDPKYIDQFIPHLLGAPGDEDRWIDVAIALRKVGYDKCCEATYAMALQRFPKSCRLWNNQGVLFRHQKQFGKAVSSLQKALSIKPDYAIAMNNLGNVYELSKNFLDAGEWYRRAIKANPQDANSCNGLANCLFALGDDDDEAFEYYHKAIAIDPDYAEPQFNTAMQMIRRGQRAQANEKLQAYLERWPEDIQAQELLELTKDTSQELPEIHDAYVPERPKWITRPIDNTNYEKSGDTAISATDVPPKPFASSSEYAQLTREQATALGQAGFYDRANLWRLVKDHVDNGAPPEDMRIFLSYRWENDLHREWVRGLADSLDERGYDVILDQFAMEQPISEMISLIATCSIFMPVLTDGYFERIDVGDGPVVSHEFMKDGWVFDEYQVALSLAKIHRLKIAGMWRSGRLRDVFTTDNTIDMRDDRRMEMNLDRVFPRRKLVVIGTRNDETGRMIVVPRFSQIPDTIKLLRDTNEFDQITIVNG